MPLGTRNWGGTEYHDSIFDPESQPQEYEQPYVSRNLLEKFFQAVQCWVS